MPSMKTIHEVGIIMNGVTGRMGLNQHLKRSIQAILSQGGVQLPDNEVIMPKPLLVGRNAAKLDAIAKEAGGLQWSTDVDSALSDPAYSIYFDAQQISVERWNSALIRARLRQVERSPIQREQVIGHLQVARGGQHFAKLRFHFRA